MKENKSIKIFVLTTFLILAIIAIAVMGFFIYNLSTKNKTSAEEINELNSKVSTLENTINNYQDKINSISNVLNTNNVENNNNNNSSIVKSLLNIKYSEITKKLENNDLLKVSDAIKNNNDTYTLRGEIITVDTSKEQVTEYPSYKKTGEYKEITIPLNTKCQYNSYDENTGEETATDTVENVFSKKLYSTDGMGACFNFTFENGKCVLVYEVATGH